jgi:hypothetical protein
MIRIAVDYPKAPPGAEYEVDMSWTALQAELLAGQTWIATRSIKRDRPEVLNMTQVLRVRLIGERSDH